MLYIIKSQKIHAGGVMIYSPKGWWYPPHFVRWWYAKSVTWIKKVVSYWYDFFGADDGIWTHTSLNTGTWNQRVCRSATSAYRICSLFLHGENSRGSAFQINLTFCILCGANSFALINDTTFYRDCQGLLILFEDFLKTFSLFWVVTFHIILSHYIDSASRQIKDISPK